MPYRTLVDALSYTEQLRFLGGSKRLDDALRGLFLPFPKQRKTIQSYRRRQTLELPEPALFDRVEMKFQP
jgi:hypothetical protein